MSEREQYEYKVLTAVSGSSLEWTLNKYGRDGWRFVKLRGALLLERRVTPSETGDAK